MHAFWNCLSLASVVSCMENPCEIDAACFPDDVFVNTTLSVPQGAIDRYRTTGHWNKFASIDEFEASSSVLPIKTAHRSIHIEGRTITIYGAEDGERVTVYNTNGEVHGTAVVCGNVTSVKTSLPVGSVAIVRIGQRAVKIQIKQ